MVYINQFKEILNIKDIELKDNSLLKNFPEAWESWDFIRNESVMSIYDATKSGSKKVFWLCDKGHSYQSKICHYTYGSRCPYCCKTPKLLKGFNDVWTTNPKLASCLLNKSDGYKYTQSSKKKVDWVCPKCSSVVKNKAFYHVCKNGVNCPNCSDGISFPEKVLLSLLKELKIAFVYNQTFKWSGGKRYDFYLPDFNMIIETHGEQHYVETTLGKGLEKEIKNDRYKKDNALKNGIKKYIELDCRVSELNYIRNAIEKEKLELLKGLDDIVWKKVNEESTKSYIIKACEMWNEGLKIKEIAGLLNVNRNTVAKYLKQGNNLNICEYYNPSTVKIAQFNKDGSLVKTWSSIAEASKKYGISESNVTSCCQGKQLTAKGYKWMYEDEYMRIKNSVLFEDRMKDTVKKYKSVVRINIEDGTKKYYSSSLEAANDMNLNNYSHISSCCLGKRKTAYGYKWEYINDNSKRD